MQLFDQPTQPAPQETPDLNAPLAWKLAPKSLEDYVGQDHLVGVGKPLRRLIENDQITSLILWGPPGCGKTGLSRLIAKHTKAHYISINAVMAKIADIKDAVAQAKVRRDQMSQRTILFIDEIHRFSKTQQDALLPSVENGLLTLIGATTENPFFSIIPGLSSRSQIFELHPLSEPNLNQIIDRALQTLNISMSDDAKEYLIHFANGDARKLISVIEMASKIATDNTITKDQIESITQTKGIAGNLDAHYDLISAYIKSMRASDKNASLYWLARLLKGGEDPRFIARRMVIFASEDIGIADTNALPLATAALQAAQIIGMPEVQINFAHVTTYLAQAPKSTATYKAIKKANDWIENGHVYPVPDHLKSKPTNQAADQNYLLDDMVFFDS